MSEKLGRYEIQEKLGEGGFAIVYRARDADLDRVVALKELRSLLITDETWVKRFRREAKAIARLDHPRIVTIHDVGEAEGRHFIVMRLVNGPSLDELLATRGRFSWKETIEMVMAMAEGLDFAHRQGVLHRDLKPGNVLVDKDRGPMLSDFGFAKLAGESSRSVTVSGDVVGTPHYIAPEAWEGQEATAQADIYALGCILYEMVTGEKLFQGETPPAVMMAHFKPLELPSRWPDSVPTLVSDVLTKALAKTPQERYATAGELAQALTGQDVPEPHPVEPPLSIQTEAAEGISESEPDTSEIVGGVDRSSEEPTEAQSEVITASDTTPEPGAPVEVWQHKAEQALAAGNLEGARSAAYQWQELDPDAPDLLAFQQKLQAQLTLPGVSTTTPAPTTPPPQMVRVQSDRRKHGCLWVTGIGAIGVVLVAIIAVGGLCSTLNNVVAEIFPEIEIGETIEEPIRIAAPAGIDPANLTIEFGSGELFIRPGAEDGLVEGLAHYNVSQLKPEIRIENNEVHLGQEVTINPIASWLNWEVQNEWDLKLNDEPVALTLSTGGATGNVDLGGLSLTDLNIHQGAAKFNLLFSEPNLVDMKTFKFTGGVASAALEGLANTRAEEIIFEGGLGEFTLDFSGDLQRDLKVDIQGGGATITIIIPDEIAAQVTVVENEGTTVSTSGNWDQVGNEYVLSAAGPEINIEVNLGAGNLRLRNR